MSQWKSYAHSMRFSNFVTLYERVPYPSAHWSNCKTPFPVSIIIARFSWIVILYPRSLSHGNTLSLITCSSSDSLALQMDSARLLQKANTSRLLKVRGGARANIMCSVKCSSQINGLINLLRHESTSPVMGCWMELTFQQPLKPFVSSKHIFSRLKANLNTISTTRRTKAWCTCCQWCTRWCSRRKPRHIYSWRWHWRCRSWPNSSASAYMISANRTQVYSLVFVCQCLIWCCMQRWSVHAPSWLLLKSWISPVYLIWSAAFSFNKHVRMIHETRQKFLSQDALDMRAKYGCSTQHPHGFLLRAT